MINRRQQPPLSSNRIQQNASLLQPNRHQVLLLVRDRSPGKGNRRNRFPLKVERGSRRRNASLASLHRPQDNLTLAGTRNEVGRVVRPIAAPNYPRVDARLLVGLREQLKVAGFSGGVLFVLEYGEGSIAGNCQEEGVVGGESKLGDGQLVRLELLYDFPGGGVPSGLKFNFKEKINKYLFLPYQIRILACSTEVARLAEANHRPSEVAANAYISYPWPYSFCISGQRVFCMSVSSVGGAFIVVGTK